MTTAPAPSASTALGATPPLRLRLTDTPGRDHLDGAWWPHSRDLSTELAALVDDFPADRARVVRAIYSPPDWDAQHRPLRRLRVDAGEVKVGFFPADDTHLLLLTMSDRSVWHLAVVPPHFTPGQGEEAMLAAATTGNAHSAADLLQTVEGGTETRRSDHWTDSAG